MRHMIFLNVLNLINKYIFTFALEFKMRLATGGSKHAFFPMKVLSGSH